MSKNIYGIHEYDERWGSLVKQAGRQAWTLLLTELSGNYGGIQWNEPNITPIVRLNWGYGRTGTIPTPDKYDEFAKRCAEFVKNSHGLKRFHIGNELSLEWEWPDGRKPTMAEYVSCYHKVYDAIKKIMPDAMVTFAPPAPWNPTFEGDWVDLIPKMCKEIGYDKIDFIAIHAYTKGYELEKFDVLQPMNPPYQHRNFSFAVLYEQIKAIPNELKHLEIHITEANGDGPWSENHSGRWAQTFYHKIEEWNRNNQQKILSGILFRYNSHDAKWHIDDRSLNDFRESLQWNYQHNYNNYNSPPINIVPNVGPRFATVVAEAGLNLRKTSVNGEILTVLNNLQTVQKIKEENGWALVVVPNVGLEGWVSAQYLK
jgi:hypothetical protein